MLQLKSRTDIEEIRKASELLVHVLDFVATHCVEGISTLELDAMAQKKIYELGAAPSFLGYQGYPNALCTSINDEVIHGIPSATVLRDGDIIGIDCGVKLGKYYSDAAQTVAVGSVAKEIQKLLDVTYSALCKGIEAGSKGKRVGDISRAVYNTVNEEGYGTVRMFSGHGVGFAVHEDPSVPNFVTSQSRIRLREGMVLAIEPMVCLGEGEVYVDDDQWTVKTCDGKVAAHFEHTVAYIDGNFEILTKR